MNYLACPVWMCISSWPLVLKSIFLILTLKFLVHFLGIASLCASKQFGVDDDNYNDDDDDNDNDNVNDNDNNNEAALQFHV